MTLPDAQGKHPQVFHAGSSTRAYVLAVLGLTFVGLLLRLFCARGDLWLDEIWSLQNLANIHGIGDIFWGISQDNNHYLNSLWLWLVGPNAPPVLIRLEAVICGTLTIPIAARLCGRAGAAAGLAGAALTAGSDLFVHYGSEARGYAGLLLMIFVAAEALERFLESDPASRNAGTNAARWAFGGAIGLGALFHLTMLTAAASLFVAALIRLALRRQSLRQLAHAAIDLAIPAILGAVPALGFVIAGILNTHKIILGTQIPFSFAHLAQGLATLIEATVGLPYTLPSWVTLVITLAAVGLLSLVTPKDRLVLPMTVLLLPPAVAALAHVPNVHIARFHLVGALGLVLLTSQAFAWLLSARQRILTLMLAAGIASGNAFHISQLLTQGRGHYQNVVRYMESKGQTTKDMATYASNMPAEVIRTIRFYDVQLGDQLAPDAAPDWCKAPPDWYILSDEASEEAPRRAFGPAACAAEYKQEMVEVPAPLSGLRWALYRRLP